MFVILCIYVVISIIHIVSLKLGVITFIGTDCYLNPSNISIENEELVDKDEEVVDKVSKKSVANVVNSQSSPAPHPPHHQYYTQFLSFVHILSTEIKHLQYFLLVTALWGTTWTFEFLILWILLV